MADIKYNIVQGSPETLLSFSRLNDRDIALIETTRKDTVFDQTKHRVDSFFYSLDGRLLSSNIDSRTYSVFDGGSRGAGEIVDITLDPEKDVVEAGFKNGDVNVVYNFLNNLFTDSNSRPSFFIQSISSDRTEIRALTNDISSEDVIKFTTVIKDRLDNEDVFEDFRINFSRNVLPIGVNIDTIQYEGSQALLVKLYEPLPTSIQVKDRFLVEELVGDSVLYEVVTEVTPDSEIRPQLKGPNFNIELVEENNNPTGYLNYDELFSYSVGSTSNEVFSLFNEKGAQISIDHTDFQEFILFSSAEERIRNFYYKVSLYETYSQSLAEGSGNTENLEDLMEGIVNNFDHYDRFLFYESGSLTWPKSNSARPYQLYSTGSTEVQNWFSGIITSASLYDDQNLDRLINAIPPFIREDSNNQPYSLFVDMIGQHFDNLWVYSKAVTDKYNADNRLDYGISKDLVRDAIQNFGIKLYNNNEALENLFSTFIGETYNTGSELITSVIVAVEGSGSLSGSVGNEHLQPVSKNNYQKEIYKRIYHNLPLLLKSKGTERGLRALINCYGIPSDVLSIKTYGGADTTSTPFYGPNTEVTSSLSKIRVSNTDSVVTGSTLSQYTSVVNLGKDYSTDLHTVNIGFSPTDSLNEYIRSHPSMSAFDIDQYIGDPGLAYSSSYDNLDRLASTVFTSGSSYINVYDTKDFVRLIKFFDNSIFRVVKEFLPARTNVDTGIVIKPHILDRSKVKQPTVNWSNQTPIALKHTGTVLDYTGSYYGSNFQLEGTVSTGFVTGSNGLGNEYTSSYTENYLLPSGGLSTLTRNNHDEANYTGEYSGSILRVSNGELNRGNNFKRLTPETFRFNFLPEKGFLDIYNFLGGLTSGSNYLMGIISNTATYTSQSQTGEGITPLTMSFKDRDDYTVSFELGGGPVDFTDAVADSGSLIWYTDEELEDSKAVSFNVEVKFNDLNGTGVRIFDSVDDYTSVKLRIVSGSTIAAEETITRTSLNASTETKTLIFSNTSGVTLDGLTPDYYLEAVYRSNYWSDEVIVPTKDVEITTTPRILTFNSDAVTLWVSESIQNDFTSSFIEGVLIPRKSQTNGDLNNYLRDAKEIVFDYVEFIEEDDQYNSGSVSYEIEGAPYKASVNLVEDDIYLTHITSAPYSASFSQSIADLPVLDRLEFNFTAEFASLASNYTSNPATTAFITASIRDSVTKLPLPGLEYKRKQSAYPENNQRSLSYINNSASTLSNLEFYYQVNVPSAFGAGAPIINLKSVDIIASTPGVASYNAQVLTRKRLSNSYYYKLKETIEIPSSSLTYGTVSNDTYNFGFIPGVDEKFQFNDYAATSNNVSNLRKSKKILKVDEKTFSPTQGSYVNFLVPANYELLSSSLAYGLKTAPEGAFAEVQDSNYTNTGWTNARYGGTEETNKSVLGNEPYLFYETFEGSIFNSGSTLGSIRQIYSGSTPDTTGTPIYFTTLSGSAKLPSSLTAKEIAISGSNDNLTFLATKQNNNYIKIIDSKVYKIDTSQILITNDRGEVINIE